MTSNPPSKRSARAWFVLIALLPFVELVLLYNVWPAAFTPIFSIVSVRIASMAALVAAVIGVILIACAKTLRVQAVLALLLIMPFVAALHYSFYRPIFPVLP
jgi:hypothetical protein